MGRARSWLVEHHYLLLRERDIRRLVPPRGGITSRPCSS
jgi:hypothetical protein